MNDMRSVIVAKSDQINADDMLGGPMTVTISKVDIKPGTEQPVSITFDGSEKFYRPCKSMCRVMVSCWGPDANAYVGRSMTLYCDPKVTWGGMAVGGIRISHMSHLEREHTLALTATRSNRKPFTVKPLAVAKPAEPKKVSIKDWLDALRTELVGAGSLVAVEDIAGQEDVQKALTGLKNGALAELKAMLADAMGRFELSNQADDEDDGEFPGDKP